MKADNEKRCRGATEWNATVLDESSILFESQSKPCPGEGDSHMIAKIIHGKHNFIPLIYASMGDDLEPATLSKWVAMLQNASVEAEAPGDREDAVDVGEVIPFSMDKVMTALNPAMESVNCNVKESSPDCAECKRPRVKVSRQNNDVGGESVTAVLEAQGDQTRIRTTTGKGFYGRLGMQS